MTSFDDVLRGANDRMDFDPYFLPVDPKKSWELTFKANPRKTVGMEFSRVWQQAWKDDKHDASKPTEKTTSKLNVTHGDWKTCWTFSNEKFSLKAAGNVLNSDGYKGSVTATAESKFLKEQWKVTGEAKVTTPDLGSVNVGADVAVEHDSTGLTKLKPKVNFLLSEEVFFGMSGEHDTKDLLKGLLHVVYVPKAKDCRYWVRGDLTKTLLSSGCDHKLNETTRHSFEGVYDWSGAAGMMGYPLGLRGGVDYDLSDATNLNTSASWGSDINVNQQVSHKCDKNWTVSATQTFDQELLKTNEGAYHIGFGVTYKL